MSGYNEETGIFELTGKKLGQWLRREDLRNIFPKKQFSSTMTLAAALFRHFGYEVLLVRSNFLRVRATPEQVWEALSGQPSDPERAKHHYQKPLGSSDS